MDDRTRRLIATRRKLLAVPAAERVDLILAEPRPAELVRALPAQELFLSVAEAGLDDGLPLLKYASTPQVEFFFDVDAWSRDAFEPERAAQWIAALHAADPDALARWLREADEPLVVLVLARLFHVYKNDESTDQAFWPPDRPLSSHDGIYYFEPRDETPDVAAVALWDALTRLRERDRTAYEGLVEQVLWTVPAEREEEAFERRVSRLAEKGFPELEEAYEVWAATPHDAQRIARRAGEIARDAAPAGAPAAVQADAARDLPVPFDEQALPVLARAARAVDPERRERLLGDLVRLGNRFAVASLGPLGNPETHRDGLRAALGAVNLGLAEVLGEAGDDAARAGRIVAELPVFDLNRAGIAAIQRRAARARALVAGWLARVPWASERLDGALADPVHGLARTRPAFVVAGEDRPFRNPEDLAIVDRALDAVEAFGAFVVALGVGPEDLPELSPLPLFRETPADVDWSAVALTALGRAALGEAGRPVPLDRDTAQHALDVLLDRGAPRRATPRLRELAAAARLGGAADYLAGVLEQDAGELPPGVTPDPRFVRALLFRAAGV